ncbi:MAG: hypothetical protein WAN44_19945, partial [Propionibacteriaceae bacterium]
ALAVLAAPPSRIAVANTVAAAVRNRMLPPEDDADGAVTVLETGLSSTDERTAVPRIFFTGREQCLPIELSGSPPTTLLLDHRPGAASV